MAQAKDAQVTRLLSQHDVVILQEVRGAAGVVQIVVDRFAATHRGWASTMNDGASGGVVILVSNAIVKLATEVEAFPIVLGRVLRLTLRRGNSDRLDLVNVHNEGLSCQDRAHVLADFRATAIQRGKCEAARLL